MEIKELKKKTRDDLKKIRKSIPESVKREEGHKVYEKLCALDEFQKEKLIYCFVSFGEEIDTLEFIEHCLYVAKKVAVPRVEGNKMEFYSISSIKELSPSNMGIPEPEGYSLHKVDHEKGIMIMPGLGFDRQMHRIGYGGGYFDKYIAGFADINDVFKVGVAFDEQIADHIESDSHDISPDMIITPSFSFRKKTDS